ncbi:tubulin tyrosine ligase, putative [Bodo saltans]|uniref:Tubulin tyrosine ligase, putative n=1 Tax=Bodo saltans TaxID=75058 RepID=A0A0S4JEF0_BODSA|nr:tubulin tyrosine ligase, putative [Bodo saltans]|eukprot:CUG88411.1 tubulin tyrosine ligase, putative [Bodo saltans]
MSTLVTPVEGKDQSTHATAVLRYKTDFEKCALNFVFRRLSWELCDDNSQWHFHWMTVGHVRNVFSPESSTRLNDLQIINHFPNHYELTRKDLMYKNIKRYFRDPANSNEKVLNSRGDLRLWDCVPITYSVPSDMSLFVEEFKRHPGSTWIVKPTNRSQGKGIFLVNKLTQMNRWLRDKLADEDQNPFIVSRYIDKPLLIGGKKFDLRLYVLVTSFRPLVAYLHRQGFARFCATKYSHAIDEDDLGSHLTNVALQKGEDEYNELHGGKWSVANLWLYIQATFGHQKADNLMDDICFVVTQTLKALQPAMLNDKHCFELYGYDVLVDENLQPHLIEVNASPSLTVTTMNDRLMKEEVLHDVFSIVMPPGFPSPSAMPYWEYRTRTDLTTAVSGGFKLISDPIVVGS